LDVIKVAFCNPKKLADSDIWVLKVLSTSFLDIEQYMFKLAMNQMHVLHAMVKPIDVNP
jgi:hypothetical protein